MSSKMVFADRKRRPRDVAQEPWKVLVVDDEVEVHDVTRLALRGLRHRGRPLEILSAFNAAEAQQILAERQDLAIVLLDVVMETDDAGLRLVHYIREILKNRFVRIILRTGQPGQAPEERVIVDYDINDYKAKTELTAQKLLTTTLTALRAYDDIMALEAHRRGLRQIIDATDSLFQTQSLQQFAAGVLLQLGTILGVGNNGILCVQRKEVPQPGIYVLAASSGYEVEQYAPLAAVPLREDMGKAIRQAFDERADLFGDDYSILYLGDDRGQEIVAYLHCPPPAESLAMDLIGLFSSKIAIGFANLYLYEQVVRANEGLEAKVRERTAELEQANAVLERLATTDPLTGARNRRSFFEAAEREMTRARRIDSPLAAVMLDIDHFKAINDRHGHAAGDIVLRTVVERLHRELRNIDLLGRLGGEEFAILLPDTPAAGGLVVAERLRHALAAEPMDIDGAALAVTASLGVVDLRPGENTDALLARADAGLYAAKKGGRNRVIPG